MPGFLEGEISKIVVGMFKAILDWLLPDSDAFRSTIATLSSFSPPNLNNPAFMQQYRSMWGVAVTIALPLLLWHAARMLRRNGEGSVRTFANLFLVTTLAGHFGIAVIWMGQIFSQALTQIVLMLLGSAPEKTWADRLLAVPSGATGGLNIITTILQLFANLVFQMYAFVTERSILVLGTLIIVALVVYFIGNLGEQLFGVVVGAITASLFSTPLMILVLVVAAKIIDSAPPGAPSAGQHLFSSIMLFVAAYVPIWIFKNVRRKSVQVAGGHLGVTGENRSNAPDKGSTVAKVIAGAGAGAALVKAVTDQGPSAHEGPGSEGGQPPPRSMTVRKIAHAALSTGAVKVAS
ncbi:MAG: hypothetical protein ABIQ64_02370, partial [Candidatus Saccharimonadales bacterium]